MTCFPFLSVFRTRRILLQSRRIVKSKDNTFVRVHRAVKLDIVGRQAALVDGRTSPTTSALLPQVNNLFQTKFVFKSLNNYTFMEC
jgi:hypothetical protein